MSTHRHIAATVRAMLALLCTAGPVFGGQAPSRELVVEAGRPLRLLLDDRVRVTRVGQPVTATLAEDVYAYDRVVIPSGSKILGHVAKLESVPAAARAAAMLGGNFTPGRFVGLRFDTVAMRDGRKVAIQTIVTPGTAAASQEVAGAHDDGIVGHARQQVALEARRTMASVRAPGKFTRLGHYLVGRLPLHPQYLEAGSAFNAQLVEPITLGTAERLPPAPDGTQPPAGSILSARLLTALDSKATPRGAPVKAVLTRPLLSAAHEVILPEGTIVSGKVTFVKSARGLRRNGQLRFLFETMEVPGRSAETVAASLFSADIGRDQNLQIDEEGGAKVTNPKSRFAAPALAAAAMVVPLDRTEISDEGLGALTTEANVVGHGVKGFAGFGLIGVGLSIVSRPAAVAFGAFGLGHAVYANLLGKGHDVVFPINTPIQMQLSPGAPAR
jgi:hypothetical protein